MGKDFFDRLLIDQFGAPVERHVIAALSSILLRISKVDEKFSIVELKTILRFLSQAFALKRRDTINLVRVGAQVERSNLEESLKLLREHYDDSQRFNIAILFWVIAYADGLLDEREQSDIEKFARRLGLTTTEIRTARNKARQIVSPLL
jgi:uncharacterized tellurite resistance protein B-like protein